MINPLKRQSTATIGVIAALIVAVVFYYNVNPAECRWMPQCVFHNLTGYDCPGCGFQRALYAVLHGDIARAWKFNPFMFFIVPVGLCYLAVELSRRPLPKLRRIMFSPSVLYSLIGVIVIWWIVRNL